MLAPMKAEPQIKMSRCTFPKVKCAYGGETNIGINKTFDDWKQLPGFIAHFKLD
jgi:hypothetical protein